jgi:uncharacterized Fe-S radical SAM superfamily protein PflX
MKPEQVFNCVYHLNYAIEHLSQAAEHMNSEELTAIRNALQEHFNSISTKFCKQLESVWNNER